MGQRFIFMHDAEVQTTEEDILEYQTRFLPNKAAQALAGNLDLRVTNKFCEDYLFNGYRLKQIDLEHARAALQLILQANHAAVATCLLPEATVPIRDQVVRQTNPATPAIAVGAWFRAYYLGLIAGADDLLTKLQDPNLYYDWMITDDLYAPYNQGHYLFLAFLPEPETALVEYERSARAVAKIPDEWRVLIDIFYPLWRPVLQGDQAAFDQALEAAILRHKAYWGKPTDQDPDNMNDPKGHYSLEITAIMACAHRLGLQVNIDSDYTPLALARGQVQVDLETKLEFYF